MRDIKHLREGNIVNKRQARRIALAVEASYFLLGGSAGCITEKLSDADVRRFREAHAEMAWSMLRKAGFDEPMSADEIIAAVLG